MPLVWILFAAFIGAYLVKIVFRVFAALGIGIIVYKGGTALVEALQTKIGSNFGGLPADILQIFGLMKIDVAITMILSAYIFGVVINGFRWVKK